MLVQVVLFVELWAKDTTEKTLKDVEARIKQLGKTIGIVGAAMAATGAAMMAPFLRGLGIASEWGRETQTAMRETGLSFQEFDLLTDGMRVGAEELVPALAHMSSFLQDAANGSEEAARRLDMMHLSLDGLLAASQGERALRIADAISNMGDVAQRVAMQRGIFGRGGLALNIEGGRAGIEERDRQAERFQGPALNTEAALIAIRTYNAAMRELGQVTQGIWASIGQSITPAMVGFVRAVSEILVRIREWIDEHQNLIAVVFLLGGALSTIGTAITFLGGAFWIVGGAMSAFMRVASGVWAVVTSLGGALALIQYAAMIIGFGAISTVVLAARVALYSYKLALIGVTAATWLYNFALGVYEGVMGTVTVATAAASTAMGFSRGVWVGHTIAVYAATAAAWVYNAALWALTTGFGVLTVVQGIAAIGAAAWLWIVSESAIFTWFKTAAVWALNAALTAAGAIYNFVTVSLWAMTAAEIAAWIWEVILTNGAALLAGAFFFLFGSIVIVTSALAVLTGGLAAIAVGIGLLGVRFGQLHQSLAWIDDVVDFVASIPSMIVTAWNYLADVVTTMVHAVVDALAWLRSAAAQVWHGINDLIDAFDSDSIDTFMSAFAYAAIGLMIFIPLWDYVLTQFLTFENLSSATTHYLEMIRDGFVALGTAVLDYFLAPFRFAAAAAEAAVASIQAAIDAWVAYLQGLVAQVIAPFIRIRDAIIDAFTSAIAWVRAQFEALASIVNGIIDRILGPFAYLRDRILDFFAVLVQRIGDYFGGIVMAAQSLYMGIVVAFGNAIDRVRQLWADLAAWFQSLFDSRLLIILRQVWAALVSAARAAVVAVQAAFAILGDVLLDMLLMPFRLLREFIYLQFGAVIDAMYAIFVAVVRAMTQIAVSLWDAWVRIGQAAVTAFINIARAIRDTVVGVWDAFASGFRETMNGVIATATGAGQAIWSAISSTFARLTADAHRVWDGIRRAFNAGDWNLIWQIAKAAASVGWLEIKSLGMQAWIEVKHAAMSIFDDISVYFADAFEGAMTQVRKGFNTMIGEIKALWAEAMGEVNAQAWELAARNPLNSEAQAGALNAAARSARSTAAAEGRQARGHAVSENAQLDRQGAGASVDRQAENVQAQMDIEAARARAREAERTGTAAQLTEARRALDELLARAHQLPDSVRNGAGAFEQMANRAQVRGTFSAASALGWTGGAAGAESARMQQQMRDDLAAAAALQRLMERHLATVAELMARIDARDPAVFD